LLKRTQQQASGDLQEGKTSGFQLLGVARSGDTQEDQNGTVQPHHILVAKAADTFANSSLRNSRDPIDL
jgi:hypothetical protein